MSVRIKAVVLMLLMFAGLTTSTAALAVSCKRVTACADGNCQVYLVCEDGSVWKEA